MKDGVGCNAGHYLPAEMAGKIVPDEHIHEHATCFNVKDRGLVVLSSCGHVGIVNSAKQAQEVSGVKKIHALAGGFHLGPAPGDYLNQVIAEIKALDPDVIIRCIAAATISSAPCASRCRTSCWSRRPAAPDVPAPDRAVSGHSCSPLRSAAASWPRRQLAAVAPRGGAAECVRVDGRGDVEQGAIGGSFSLVDHNGQRRTNDNFRGKLLLVTFGFTFCADVCPIDLQSMATTLTGSVRPATKYSRCSSPSIRKRTPPRNSKAMWRCSIEADRVDRHCHRDQAGGTRLQGLLCQDRAGKSATAPRSTHTGFVFLVGKDGQYLGFSAAGHLRRPDGRGDPALRGNAVAER